MVTQQYTYENNPRHKTTNIRVLHTYTNSTSYTYIISIIYSPSKYKKRFVLFFLMSSFTWLQWFLALYSFLISGFNFDDSKSMFISQITNKILIIITF